MALIPVFKLGTHTTVKGRTITFTLENCIDLVKSYDPSVSEAPAVIGHPKLTAPAYGWAKTFQIKDGLVYAELDQVNSEAESKYSLGIDDQLPPAGGVPRQTGSARIFDMGTLRDFGR